ncbi:MAG: hypothetical protein KJO55_07420, partial [Gammaproteobacteria bacterium]|nr:hypothetical protein [Gammaproteobacteria bacterium]
MSANYRARLAQFGPLLAIVVFLAGCPNSPDIGEVRPPAPPPDFSIKVDFGFEAGEVTPDANGDFTVGDPPVTATFKGGEIIEPANPDLVRERSQIWSIAEGQSGEITFASPAKSFEFFFRNEFEPPTPTTGKASRQVECGVFDLGLNNGEAFGSEVFVRGAFNSWAGASSEPPTNFVNNGDGTYTAEFEIVASALTNNSSPFKIASEDWALEYSNEGAETIVVDTPIAIALSGAGSDNSTFTVPNDGCYTWTISNIDTSATPTTLFDVLVTEKLESGGGAEAGSEIKVYDTFGEEIAAFPGTTLY